MLGDVVILLGLCLGVAIAMTAWVAIVFGLVQRPPRWHALASFFVPPLALVFAWRERMRHRFFWAVFGLVIEAIALIFER